MIGKDLTFKQQESYYFQLIPKRLILKTEAPEPTSTFRLSIHKGVQKLQSSKQPITAEFSQDGNLDINDVSLKFNLPNFSPYKKVDFAFKVFIHDGAQQSQVGSVILDTVKLINSFKNEKVNSVTETLSLGQYLDLDYSLCVEKSLYNLQKESKSLSGRRAGSEVGSLKGSAKLQRQQIQQISANKRSSRPVVSSIQPTQEPTPAPKYQAKPARQKSQTSQKKRTGVDSASYRAQSNSKKSDVRERVNKLQNDSQEDYSLHAPKAKGTELKKSPARQTTLRQSRLKRQVDAEKLKQSELAAAKTADINWKQIIFKILFLIVSAFLIYSAMTPTKRFSSKKRH